MNGDRLIYIALHPQNPIGRRRVSIYLLNFFRTDDTTVPWFMAD